MNEITCGIGLYNSENGKLKFKQENIYLNFFSSYHQLDIDNRNDFELFMKDVSDGKKFNRHSILHGKVIDFGSEQNAIKAILLLLFLADIKEANN